jgi:3-oxoacyl-[acyl-carrier protein] reductase
MRHNDRKKAHAVNVPDHQPLQEGKPVSRTVLVTGGSKGIGLATALAFSAAGDRVAVTHHSSPPPDGLFAVPCDVASSTSVDAAFTTVEQELGPVQVLVCAAGITRDKPLIMMKDDDLAAVIDTNLNGTVHAVRRALRKMVPHKFGRIVLVSSVVGRMGAAGQINYAATKAALTGVATSAAREYGPKGITVNVVAPGLIDTDMAKTIPAARRDEMIKEIPAGLIGQPTDVARMILFLADDASSFINGGYFPVDG